MGCCKDSVSCHGGAPWPAIRSGYWLLISSSHPSQGFLKKPRESLKITHGSRCQNTGNTFEKFNLDYLIAVF